MAGVGSFCIIVVQSTNLPDIFQLPLLFVVLISLIGGVGAIPEGEYFSKLGIIFLKIYPILLVIFGAVFLGMAIFN